MGKAFTEEERSTVREKLRRTGLKLFAEKGIKGVSIRDLTAAAGISQGGFYSFYRDKGDFLSDLVELRVREKLALLRERTPESLHDPVAFLTEVLYREGCHLKDNMAFNNVVSDSVSFFFGREEDIHGRADGHYRSYFADLAEYWEEHGYRVQMDVDGLMQLIRAAGILFTNASLLEETYFERIYAGFCASEVPLFLEVERA